ncbi:virulence protein [uncultured Jannaschia sp.]|uniref:virulence protein n=1 Tax=uncultured Jannaschia sp. TaxID=293347 RepID=UPI0026260137|nr:virulence protein [uncultured Jannaschia sp.]
MKLVTFFSLKGGAGKTTGLMSAVSGLRMAGYRTALLEADKNDPLKFWRGNAMENGTWDADCKIFEATTGKEMAASYASAQRAGYDIAVFDAEGGESDVNTDAILSSDLILVPLALSSFDVEYGISSFEFAREALEANGRDVPIAFLICRFPAAKSKLTKADLESFEILKDLPQVSTRLPSRAAYADMGTSGMLHLYYAGLREDPALRVTSISIKTALEEARSLAADITDGLEMEQHNADPKH